MDRDGTGREASPKCAKSGGAARRPTGTEDGQCKERENALYEALRGQKTPLPGTRTVSAAPVPQVVLPYLGGEVVHDVTLVAFLVRQTLLEREEEKRKEKEKEKELEEERRRKALDSIEHMLEQMLGHKSSSSAVKRRKRKKKRKKRLPRAPRPHLVARHQGRYEPEGLLRAHR